MRNILMRGLHTAGMSFVAGEIDSALAAPLVSLVGLFGSAYVLQSVTGSAAKNSTTAEAVVTHNGNPQSNNP